MREPWGSLWLSVGKPSALTQLYYLSTLQDILKQSFEHMAPVHPAVHPLFRAGQYIGTWGHMGKVNCGIQDVTLVQA